jgi:hypothetical protein
MSVQNTIQWYDANAGERALRYEAVRPDAVHGWFADLLRSTASDDFDVLLNSGHTVAHDLSMVFDLMKVLISARPTRSVSAYCGNACWLPMSTSKT